MRDTFERLLGRFSEGPEPPARLAQLVVEFANANPRARRAEWVAMAKKVAEVAYRSGYVRGWEATVRDKEAPWRRLPPELVADTMDPDWRWRPVLGEELANPDDFVEDEVPAAPVDVQRHRDNRPPEDR
jgi:hypothetical protein